MRIRQTLHPLKTSVAIVSLVLASMSSAEPVDREAAADQELIVKGEGGLSREDFVEVIQQRLAEGWVPTHSPEAKAYLTSYYEEVEGKPQDVNRLKLEPSGLAHSDIHSVINDRTLGPRFFEIHADLMHPDPDKSVYIDPIFGAFYGQSAIRKFLIPVMTEAGAISFDAVYPAVYIDDGEGGTSVDEWQLSVYVDGEWVPGFKGISIREYRDGWMTYASDNFDTTPLRMAEAARGVDLPPWPRIKTERDDSPLPTLSPRAQAFFEQRQAVWRDAAEKGQAIPDFTGSDLSNQELHELTFNPQSGYRWEMIGDLMHPTESEYHDPIFGTVRGQTNIRNWLVDIMGKAGNVVYEPIGPTLFSGDMSFQESRQMAILPSGERVFMTRAASVRRYRDGYVVYAHDYFDTAPFTDPEIQAASTAAGSVLTIADIERYRELPAETARGQRGD